MTDDELRAAAEHLAGMHDAPKPPRAHSHYATCRAVGAKLLELLPPADDGEPITEEWLASVGFAETRSFEWENGGIRIDRFSGGRSWSWECVIGKSIFPGEYTKGQVRRLCAALGIKHKEPK